MKKITIFNLLFVILFGSVVSAQETKNITIDDIYKKYMFFPRSVYGINSMNDGIHYTVLDSRTSILKISYKTGDTIATLIDTTILYEKDIRSISGYSFSNDESKILFYTNENSIYRHSFTADYYVFDIAKKTLKALSENGQQQLATFSPVGNKVAFVRENNLFIADLEKNTETAVTNDGVRNKIINGAPDWVYEEEFGFSKAFDWSSDGKSLAFYRFDEERVKEFNMTMYGELYPEWYKFKYPKAGEDNAIVTIHIYSLESAKTVNVDIGSETDQYIPRIKWTKDANILSLIRMNRLQNKMELLLASAKDGSSSLVYTETDERYVSEVDDKTFTFLKDKKHFIVQNENDGYNHLYLYSIDGKLKNQITKGEWEVSELYGIDEKSGVVYYESTEPSPLQRAAYSIKLNGKSKKLLTENSGTNRAQFSSNFKYFINYHTDANNPVRVTLHKNTGKQVRELKNNDGLKKRMKAFGFATKEFITITTSENIKLNASIIKPADFDPSKEYPVMMYVYGGPGSQTVRDEWDFNIAWWQMLAQQGYIVVSVDNRGTGARGEEFKKCTYEQLGKYETIDQIEAAKYLASLSYVDGNRIGIFGWSYGGYMSTLCLTKGAEQFNTAIAVAPVTNWRYYDSIYTERYMGLPKDNASGYDDNSPINHVEKMKGNYLLVHGTADDNVHFQNSMELVTKLVDADVQFEQQFYPNKNHGIYGGNTRYHLYTKMTNFILENL